MCDEIMNMNKLPTFVSLETPEMKISPVFKLEQGESSVVHC